MELVALTNKSLDGINGLLMHQMAGLGKPGQNVGINEIAHSLTAAGVKVLSAIVDGDLVRRMGVDPRLETPCPLIGRLLRGGCGTAWGSRQTVPECCHQPAQLVGHGRRQPRHIQAVLRVRLSTRDILLRLDAHKLIGWVE